QTAPLPDGLEIGLVEGAVFAGFGVGKGIKDGRLEEGFPSYAFSVHIPVVEIDPETFEIKITRYVVAHDCGQVLNPLTVNGMVWGGIAHGIGAALYEHFAYDAQGQLITASFMDYLLPTASEVPTIDLYEQVTLTP